MKKDCDAAISIIAGRPGAGKTMFMWSEIENLLKEANNMVIYIGHQKESETLLEITQGKSGTFMRGTEDEFGQLIGVAIDTVNNADDDKRVFVFHDQCRFEMIPGRRDMLVAAVKAGVIVTVLCQRFCQVSRNDDKWLRDNCSCQIISKRRPPRLATEEEMFNLYR